MKVQDGILVKFIPDCTVILCAHAPARVLLQRVCTLSLSSHLARDSGGVLCCVVWRNHSQALGPGLGLVRLIQTRREADWL
jgi:hypothetical protein